MSIDTGRLVTIANELKMLDQRREQLVSELSRIAQGIGGGVPSVGRRRGRPPGSRNRAKAAAPGSGRKRRSGITTDIVDFLKRNGGAHTAGEILEGLRLPKSKSKAATISTTLVRLAKEGRAKKDSQRGYRAA